MGLLDDAIRDHLELKRRHGADPGEVARLEHEALGPARREPMAAASVAEEEPPYVVPEDEYGDEVPAEERLDAPVHHHEPEPQAEAPAEPAPVDEPEPEPEAEVGQPTQQFSLSELEAASEEDEPAEPAEPAEGAEPAERAAGEPDPDDVLEETPEFLQETPEHDRLWFEQKPPRDFDF
jgi:hypothetical protein